MKTLIPLCALVPFFVGSFDWSDVDSPTSSKISREDDDKKAVIQAGMNYVNGLYEAKPELIEESVHPELRKFGFYRASAKDEYRPMPMTFEQLVELAGSWNKDGKKANEDSLKKVKVLDLMDTTAAIKVSAVWGVDHMQVGKFDGKWQILNILWQSHPEKK